MSVDTFAKSFSLSNKDSISCPVKGSSTALSCCLSTEGMLDSEVFGVVGRLATEFLFFFCFVGPLDNMFAQAREIISCYGNSAGRWSTVRSESGVPGLGQGCL